jgi:hypothetical protein
MSKLNIYIGLSAVIRMTMSTQAGVAEVADVMKTALRSFLFGVGPPYWNEKSR